MKEKIKDKKIIVLMTLAVLLVIVLGVSYAFFSAKIIGEGKENIVKAGTMVLEYIEEKDNGVITMENVKPPKTGIKKFKVHNTGTLKDTYTYNIKLTDLYITFKGQDLKYILQETESDYETPVGEATTGYLNVGTGSSGTIYLKTGIETTSEEIDYYTLTIEFQELDVNQNYNQGAKFSGKVNIDVEESEPYIISYTDYCGGMDDLASCMLEFANKFESREFISFKSRNLRKPL